MILPTINIELERADALMTLPNSKTPIIRRKVGFSGKCLYCFYPRSDHMVPYVLVCGIKKEREEAKGKCHLTAFPQVDWKAAFVIL